MKKLILSFIFVVSFISAYSQSGCNSLNSVSILKKQSKENNLLFSVKTGYHTGYQSERESGFNGGMIYCLNVDGSIMEETNVGLSFEFWHHTQSDYSINNNFIPIHPRTFTGTNVNFNFTKRFKGKNHSINLGLGGGLYFLNKEDRKDGDSKRTFFNLKLFWGADIRVSDIVFISPQIEYNNMINFDKMAGTFSFKIGPSIIFED